jgi:hypothetical protein
MSKLVLALDLLDRVGSYTNPWYKWCAETAPVLDSSLSSGIPRGAARGKQRADFSAGKVTACTLEARVDPKDL